MADNTQSLEEKVSELQMKSVQVKMKPTEQENLKNNLFGGINGQNLKLTWKKKQYEIPTIGVSNSLDSTTVETDCSTGDVFTLTTTQNFTMSNPTNMVDGKKIIYKIKQDGTGSRIVTWDTAFRGSTDIALPVLTTTAHEVDYIGFIYDAITGFWNCLAVVHGFAT